MEVTIIKPADQGYGQFDGGKFQEQKPIGFSGEGSRINRLGPLFYWAWGYAHESAKIGLHPHRGFEIITYVIKGQVYHRDTLGTESVVGEGGSQLMQTGSGVHHAEGLEKETEMFQIWFEPYLNEAIRRTPTYAQYESTDFSLVEKDGVTIKNVLGHDSPMNIVTDAAMWDISISGEGVYTHALSANRTLAGLAIRGDGAVSVDKAEPTAFVHKDFVVIQADSAGKVSFQGQGDALRIFLIEVPTEVGYPLYNKPR